MIRSYGVSNRRRPTSGWRGGLRRHLVVFAALTLGGVAAGIAAPAVASANAANPVAGTSGTAVVNPDGSVTVTLEGTWSWPGQQCSGRYGVGWAVDWWGASAQKIPTDAFALSNASEVVAAGPAGKPPWSQTALATGTVSPTGAIQLPKTAPLPGQPPPPPSSFHVGTYYAGEDTDLCASVEADGTPYGAWTATATYPSRADIPGSICVNLYDEHGTEGKSSGNPKDFSPSGDDDNSIQTNDFDPSDAVDSSCMSSSGLVPPGGGGIDS